MQQLRSTIEAVLLGAGFMKPSQMVLGRSLPERLLPDGNHPLQAHVELSIPDKGYSLLKISAWDKPCWA